MCHNNNFGLTCIATSVVYQNILCKGVAYPSRSKEIIRMVIIISVFTFPIMGLRIFSRHIVAKLWWDDWLIIISAVSLRALEKGTTTIDGLTVQQVCMIPMTAIPILSTLQQTLHTVAETDIPPQMPREGSVRTPGMYRCRMCCFCARYASHPHRFMLLVELH